MRPGGWFVDRGQGRFTARISVGDDDVPAFGQIEAGTGTMVFGGIAPSGSRLSVDIVVSPDINELYFPDPVGTLTRDL